MKKSRDLQPLHMPGLFVSVQMLFLLLLAGRLLSTRIEACL